MIDSTQRTMGVIVLGCLIALITPSFVKAETPHSFSNDSANCTSGTYRDLNADGKVDALVLNCAFTTAHDIVTIYPREPINEALPWQENINDQDAVWIFDRGNQGNASLIIDFHPKNTVDNAVFADLYDDQDGDRRVAYHVQGSKIIVEESPHWSVRVVAPDGWWKQGQVVNYNLDITTDGPILCGFGGVPDITWLLHSGRPDFSTTIRDKNHDGHPEYQIIQSLVAFPDPWGYARTQLTVNPKDNEPPISKAILWPYLGSKWGVVQPYGQRLPPIQVDWNQAKIIQIGEFIASRSNDNNWFAYSHERLTNHSKEAEADFESPFAYYDLANDADGYPELQVRVEVQVPGYPHTDSNLVGDRPLMGVRYSWDQYNTTSWDYKLGLLGAPNLEADMQVGDLRFKMADPANLPQRVVQTSWASLTFVASDKPYKSTEGIYQWPVEFYRDAFVGNGPALLNTDQLSITAGLRGEYAAHYNRQPMLYLSPLDQRLHVIGAEGGFWQVDKRTAIQSNDSNSDGYLDSWLWLDTYRSILDVLHSPGQSALANNGAALTAQLYQTPAGFVGSDLTSIYFQPSAVPASLFETAPPTNHTEWNDLGKLLAPYKGAEVPSLQGILARFAAPRQTLQHASLTNFRSTATGFRFVLVVQPGFHSDGNEMIPHLGDLTPGQYVVAYDKSTKLFAIKPLTPPNVSLAITLLSNDNFPVDESIPMRFNMTNAGLQDAAQATLIASIEQNGKSTEITRQVVDVRSGEPTQIIQNWQPPKNGLWKLSARLENQQGQLVAETQQSITVVKGTEDNLRAVAGISSGAGQWLPVLLVLLIIASLVGLATWLIRSNQQVEARS